MNSNQWSFWRFSRFISFSGALWLLLISVACSSVSKKEANAGKRVEPPIVADEVSLKADRSEFAEMRKEIPDDVKRENDELALVLGMMSNSNEEPSKIRERFNKAVRDRREKMDKDLRKKREDFSRTEQRTREDFLKKQTADREKFVKGKNSSDARKRFFEDQDLKRKDFFAGQADKRKEFESQVTDTRKNFEDYLREKTNSFNQEHRAYTAAFYDRKKNEALKKQAEKKAQEKAQDKARQDAKQGILPVAQPGQADPLEEFRNMPNTPVIPLGPTDQ